MVGSSEPLAIHECCRDVGEVPSKGPLESPRTHLAVGNLSRVAAENMVHGCSDLLTQSNSFPYLPWHWLQLASLLLAKAHPCRKALHHLRNTAWKEKEVRSEIRRCGQSEVLSRIYGPFKGKRMELNCGNGYIKCCNQLVHAKKKRERIGGGVTTLGKSGRYIRASHPNRKPTQVM